MKDLIIGIIGLGYVGFPLACLYAKRYHTIGYDRNPIRVDELNAGKDHTNEIDSETIHKCMNTNLVCTSDENALKKCNVYIVTVPTPVDIYMQPDLLPLTLVGLLSSLIRFSAFSVGILISKKDHLSIQSSCKPLSLISLFI